ncbi:serine/threonine-protein kinase [Streptomyces chrestomyceticus]|uniref:serine/threonine-protein kinase n=1 Tax=Streptomyces chrestomyceticus TaxID=68185 RepID=UPI0033F8D471
MVQITKQAKLGKGGQGTVWQAVRHDTNEAVAIKFPLESLDLSEGSPDRRRFVREVRLQSALRHAGIMPIVAMNLKVANPFLVMPLASHSLEDMLNLGALTEEITFSMAAEVLSALEYAHDQGVLHRDLKPANLLYLQGRWVISDFGLCRQMNSNSTVITQVNAVVGSPVYMAPEQYDNAHEVTAPADIYSVGQILYHCLVGEVPFPRARLARLDMKYRHFIGRCIAEEPEDRFQSVSEVRKEMELLTAPAVELATPTLRANELKAKALEGQEVAVPLLLRLLLDSSEDEVFYKEFVPSLPLEILQKMYAKEPVLFEKMIHAFDEYSEGGHPFDYTDDIANFFAKIIQVAEYSRGLRHLSLKRIMTVGAHHNRFHVGEVFARMVKLREKDAEDVRYIASLLSNDPYSASFMGSYLKQYSLPPAIMRVL